MKRLRTFSQKELLQKGCDFFENEFLFRYMADEDTFERLVKIATEHGEIKPQVGKL